MKKTLRILLLEDNEDDAGIIEHTLKKTGLDFNLRRVATKSEYIKHLDQFLPDLILSDHSMPNFNSVDALKICRRDNPLTPFILVTGAVSEEFAVDCIKRGADDYVLKSSLTRLPSAIANALKQKKSETERNIAVDMLQRSEEHFRKLIENSSDIFAIISIDRIIQYLSPSVKKLLGYTQEELKNKNAFDYIHADDQIAANNIFLPSLQMDTLTSTEFRFKHKNGTWHYLECISKPDSVGENTIINIRDITERKAAEDELKRKNVELEKINKELDSFVYSASHDLRAPLKSILGLVKLSQEECQRKIFDSFETYMGLMEKSVYKLDETIQEIIYYSGNARSEVQKEEIHFRTIVDEIFEKLKYMEGFSMIEKFVDIDESTPFVSDKNRVTVIFNNLISNGIKYYNPEQKRPFIKISIKQTVFNTTIVYEDNGIGIEPVYIDKIFNMFFRATEKSDGSGLGLYIVKEIVNKLKGTIEVKSTDGIGTVFKIVLPV